MASVLLPFAWTIWLLVALALFPVRKDPLIGLRIAQVLCFLTSVACFPLLAHHLTWRSFLMLWLTLYVCVTTAAIRADRRNSVPAVISVAGLLWLGLAAGGEYANAVLLGLTGVVVAGLVAIGVLLVLQRRSSSRPPDGDGASDGRGAAGLVGTDQSSDADHNGSGEADRSWWWSDTDGAMSNRPPPEAPPPESR